MAINLSKVSFAYYVPRKKKNIKYAVKDINLSIGDKDEFITIVGHTGSGKSTLVQMLNALLIPTDGCIDISGKIISKKNENKIKLKEVRKKIGLVFQFPEYQLFEETVLQDVCFGPKNFGITDVTSKAKKALELVGIKEDMYNESPFSLSGGQMRRVAIAGILASEPNILIFDEPTVGLDPLGKKELLDLLRKLNKEEHKTIILVTHDMEIVGEYSKRVIVLDNGDVVYDGDKTELFKNEKLVKEHSLDLPNNVKMLKVIKEKLSLDNLDIYKYNTYDAYEELKRVLGGNYE